MSRRIPRVLTAIAVALTVVVSAAHAVPPTDRGKSNQAMQAQGAESNPAKACKAERARLGEQGFADAYGTNANKRNAFGKCVSRHAKAGPDNAKPKPKPKKDKPKKP